MKKIGKMLLSFLLAFIMLFETGEAGIAYAADEIDKAINPAERIALTVPERFADGGNWFFVPEAGYMISEKSPDKLYIPIQRTGDLDVEAEVILKVVDLSAKHDVNYTAEIYKEAVEPEIFFTDKSIKEIALNADAQEEVELSSESELGALIHEAGGATLVDGEGNPVATVTATPLDENGNPIVEEKVPAEAAAPEIETKAEPETETKAEPENETKAEPETETVAPATETKTERAVGAVTEGEWTGAKKPSSPTKSLRAARNAFTGTTSDRQELAGSSLSDFTASAGKMMTEDEYNKAMADAVSDNYPGKEYHLTFAPGEEAKFLVVKPLYSELAEGDAQIILLLKKPGEGYAVGEDVNPVSVTILDEDESEPVTISMAEETVFAKDGKAAITVTRSGMLNVIRGVMLKSWGGSAKEGDEYSGVGAKLWFPLGITSRTVEIPVWHGAEMKDFYVTISPLNDEIIDKKTVHVIIPPAGKEGGDGELMAVSDINGHPLTDPIDLSDGSFDKGGFDSSTAFHVSTRANVEYDYGEYKLNSYRYGCAYDGIYAHYNGYLNWCDAEFRLYKYQHGSWTYMHKNYFDDGGKHDDHWLYAAWDNVSAPDCVTISAQNVDNEGAVWTDSYVAMWVTDVRFIKRQFTIKVESPELKPLIGVDDDYVLTNYEAVLFDKSVNNTRTLWSDDSFALNAKDVKGPLRLAGVEAKINQSGKDAWYRIATIDGKSGTVTVELNPDMLNSLNGHNCIKWSQNGKPGYREEDSTGYSGSFYKGEITVRPVFDYIDATVDLKSVNPNYGTLSAEAPLPNMLWDFGADMAMDDRMSISSYWNASGVAWSGWNHEGHDSYIFEAGNNDPYVSVADHAESVDNIRYLKFAAKNLNGASNLQLFASSDNNYIGPSNIKIPLYQDTAWHEYVVDLTKQPGYSAANWKGPLTYFRLDPMEGSTANGSRIIIDYMAFFSSEGSAQAFRSQTDGRVAAPAQLIYHVGDAPTFMTTVNQTGSGANMRADGLFYGLHTTNAAGVTHNSVKQHYINGSLPIRLADQDSGGNTVDHPYFSFEPTFTEGGNRIAVLVSDDALSKLNTEAGIFAAGGYVSKTHENGYWVYVIDEDILVNDLYEISAYTKSKTGAAVKWTLSDGSEFYGDTLYFRSKTRIKDNAVTLEVYDGGDLAWMQLKGTVVSSTMNLSNGRSATDKNPVKGAILTLGLAGAVSGDKGEFSFPAILARAGGKVRYLVNYNGVSTIQETKLPGLGAQTNSAITFEGAAVQAIGADQGMVRVDTYSTTGARFLGVTASQYGILRGGLYAVPMNGQEVVFKAKVAPGGEYTLNNQTYTEHIKEVRLYFQDQYTGDTHGVYSSLYEPAPSSPARWSWNEETGEFVLSIYPFDPEHETEWTYGDVLMAQLITDKRGVGQPEGRNMVYDPVSTGFGVYADPEYEPRMFDFSVDDIAETLQITPGTDEDGEPLSSEGALQDDDTRYSYGAFPYLGEITAAVKVVSKLVSTAFMSQEAMMMQYDLNLASEDFMGGDTSELDDNMTFDVGKTKGVWQETPVTFSMFFTMTDNFYGGVRFMLGAIFTYGQGNQYERTRDTKRTLQGFIGANMSGRNSSAPESVNNSGVNYIFNEAHFNNSVEEKASKFGGPYFTFSVYFGIYLCYGYVEISKNGGVEKSHEMVFMGAGGFIGFGATVGYTWTFMAGPIPMYVNLEAGLKYTFFLGSEADPNKTLEEAKTSQELHGQDFSFNFSFDGRLYATGTFGVGFFKLIGIRVSVSVGFNAGYNMNVPKWYPKLFDSGYGYTMDVTFTGTIDLVVTSIDLYSATWPIPVAGGYLYWFQEANRGNKCISYVENGLAKGNGDSAAAKAHARELINGLIPLIDNQSGTAEQIREKTKELKNYAYDHDIISWVAKNTIEMNKQAGIVGGIINGVLQDDSDPAGVKFRTQPHVNSKWVADDNAQLMSAYSVVKSTPVMEDAFHQPNSKIIGIGGNRFLMTFLDDTATRDKMQASTLKWTVYDANNDTWTAPQVVQADVTADSRPALTDAGDKVILTWASSTDAKYAALKQAFADELAEKLGREAEDVEVLEAMEADPARVMSIMDVFTAEFSKSAQSFGAITQLTDDDICDDFPLSVYDSKTKDYIVIYYKTAQDDGLYGSAGDKLNDLIAAGPDPDKTYSVVAYMLYNSQTDAVDTNGSTHEPGWARDYLFPLETEQTLTEQAAFLAEYGGQRFLPSPIVLESGEYADPPIYDLAVASGLDGLAAFAFTVDKDFNMDTAADRELYMQYYNFETHGTYVPIRVAGDKTVTREVYNSEIHDFEKRTFTQQVEVGTPKLVRNGGSTFLFWREDNTSVKYLNVSSMLNAKVAAVANPDPDKESDWTYALKADGTFATDAVTGETYSPMVEKVDVLSYMTDEDIHITDFDFITDEEDNLYVVWTDVVTTEATNEFGEEKLIPSQEIFVSGMVRQDPNTITYTDNQGTHTSTSTPARWSKPYRLTRNNAFNDGLALALDDNGGLIIVHNQFTKQVAQSEQEMMQLIAAGKIGLTTDKAGNYYASSLEYNSPVRMMVTRCDKVGSLEATEFSFTDELPVPGQVIGVEAAIENMGITNAKGYEVKFYECKNGVKGSQIGGTLTTDETIPVNTAVFVKFLWTVPEDGPEGYSIVASVREKNGSGYYDAVETESDAFKSLARFSVNVNSVTQDGDEFIVDYTVKNTGNRAVPEGYKANLLLTGLYGDLNSEKYGFIEDDELYSTALTLPAKTAEATTALIPTEKGSRELALSTVSYPEQSQSVRVSIPASVFRFCGYDGVQMTVTDKDGNAVAESGNCMVRLAEPMNLSMNDGQTVTLRTGTKKQVALDYDSNVFIGDGTVIYNVADPSIAAVSSDGELMGLSAGMTTVTATLLPSGRTTSVPVAVSGGGGGGGGTSGTPSTSPTAGTITVEVSGDEGSVSVGARVSDGTATITAPTEKQMAEITDRAGATGSATLDLSSLPDAVTAVNIPAETVKAISKAVGDNGEGLTVKLPNSTVTFDVAALESVAEQTTGSTLKLNVEPIAESRLNAKQKQTVADLDAQALYDIYLTSDNKRITEFGGGRAVIEVAHEAKTGQKLSGFAVWYAAEDGTKEKNPTNATKNSMKFIVKHFSIYVLTYSDPGECEKGKDCPMSAFNDLDLTSWYHDGVHWALENEIMSGYGSGKFGPEDATSRAMIVTMLYHMEGSPEAANGSTFTDVPEDAWYAAPIRWAASNGIVSGYGGGKFGPDDPITREQLAVILCHYAAFRGVDTAEGERTPLNRFTDAADISDWAVKPMRWAVSAGILSGFGNNVIRPVSKADRAQTATMLMHLAAVER